MTGKFWYENRLDDLEYRMNVLERLVEDLTRSRMVDAVSKKRLETLKAMERTIGD